MYICEKRESMGSFCRGMGLPLLVVRKSVSRVWVEREEKGLDEVTNFSLCFWLILSDAGGASF